MAGIEDFRFHDLQHTFASHHVMNDGDLLSLRDMQCHLYVTSEEKTQKYIKRETSQHVNITRFTDVSQVGFEPTTNGLKGRCSTN